MKSDLKYKAIKMRQRGMSYTQIKNVVNVSKGTLSMWLKDYPLSDERLKELRDNSPIRIEKYRNTRLKQREQVLENIFVNVSKKIGKLSKRDLFIAGLFLYWGEGTKSARDLVAFTNTDPVMIRFFIKWLALFDIKKDKLKIKLHLYSDMEVDEKISFWSKYLNIKKSNFRKPYIKDSKYSEITYKNKFGQGTCSVMFGSSSLYNEIMMSLKYIKTIE
jgi:hypothetical protein